MTSLHRLWGGALFGALLGGMGCADEPPPAEVVPPPAPARNPLRVIVRPDPIAFLPRNADPIALDPEIAGGLAAALDRELELVFIEPQETMIDELLAGRADLVAANLAATPARRERVAFSVPYLYVDECLVMRIDADPRTLSDIEICVRASSLEAETLAPWRKRRPDLSIIHVADDMNAEELLDLVESGTCEATVVDSRLWRAVSAYFPSLHVVRNLGEDRPIALALRPDDAELRRKVNEFLISRSLTGPRDEVYTDDLFELRRRRRLRMITRNDATSYFLHRGAQLGFEYELLKRFADWQDLRLEIVIPPTRGDLEEWLLQGKGDVVAASLTITPERAQAVDFTRRYAEVKEVVVVRSGAGFTSPDDLAGTTIHIRPGSSYQTAAKRLAAHVPEVTVATVPDSMETEEIFIRIEEGSWDATICDSNLLEIQRKTGRFVEAAFDVGATELAWAVRPENPELKAALDEFIRREYRGLFYNLARARYFEDDESIARTQDDWRSDRSGRISPYDDLAKEFASRVDLDWRLLVAQMYEESRFQTERVSFAGAVGLMQLLPKTAAELDIIDPFDPSENIRGGAEHMRWLIDRFDPQLPAATRIRFALAAYNAGHGHVFDAQRLARRLGLASDRWYGHVETAMLLLQRPEYYEQARYGYCRGSECVSYVTEVDHRYRNYVELVPDAPPMLATGDDT